MERDDRPIRKSTRRQFLVRSGQIAGVITLSACGAPGASNQGFQAAPSAAPTAAGDAAAPVASAAPSTAAPSAAGGELSGQVIISITQDVPDEAQKALIDAYRKQRPNIEVLFERPGAAEENYDTYLGTVLAAGNTWDKDYDFQLSQYNIFRENVVLPTRAVHINWFYNKTLFEKAGVEPPTTWAEFVEACDKLQAAAITPVAANYMWQVPQWVTSIYFDQYNINWVETVRAKPGDWNFVPGLDDTFKFDPNDPNIHMKYTFNAQRYWKGVRDGELRFDTPEMAELVANLAAVFPKHATQDFFVIEDNYVPFLQQQVAMMINGSWMYDTISRDMESLSPERLEDLELPENTSIKAFEWGTFEVPPMEGSLIKSPVRSIESAAGEYLSIIDKNQQQTELALDFLMFWLSAPGYQAYFDGRVEAADLNASGPLMVRDVKQTPELEQAFSQIKFMGNAENSFNYLFTDFGGGDLATDVRNLLKEALEGKMTPEEYGKRMQAYSQDNFDRILAQIGMSMADIDDPARQPGT